MGERPVAIVTGAGSGIGRATAALLAARGWDLVLVGRTAAKIAETEKAIRAGSNRPIEVISLAIDLALGGAPRRVIDDTAARFGRLDALVNNAAIGELSPLRSTTADLLDRTFRANTFAPFELLAAAWPLFERTARERAGARPCVVNVSSVAASDPFPGLGVYAATKAALESMTRSIVNERGAIDLRAFSIAPGAVETPMLRSMFDREAIPSAAALDPAVVAAEIAACIAGERDDREGSTIVVRAR
jgi:meso-butanediol dehydrogenase/(S,S)-butanediol dehydrogenase/diacetyl reductase